MTARATRVLEAVGCDAFVASDPFTVAWLTGFAADETWGPNPFAAAPLAVVRADGSVVAIVNGTRPRARGQRLRGRRLCGLHAARSTRRAPAAARLARTARPRGGRGRRLTRSRPRAGAGRRHALRLLRAVKDEARSRASAPPSDLRRGPGGGAQRVRGGVSELEAWGEVQAAMQIAAGERLSLLCDFATGERTAEIGGPPTARAWRRRARDRRPRAAPRRLLRRLVLDVAVGDVPAEVRSAHARCRGARARPRGAGPRLLAGELDAIVRAGLDYPHHAATASACAPRGAAHRARGRRPCWRPGMVVALEPGSYPGPWGMRVERLALVTETGCEVLSAHDISL